ncbi:MAG: hypothetical protein AMXMBFR34_33690 [Myxococcaceae bacterium]
MIATTALVVVLLGAEPYTRTPVSPASEPIPPDQAAAIALDSRSAQAEVAKKYGNKKPSELSNDERKQMIRDQAEAEQKVLDKHGVDRSTWARQQMAKSPKEVATQKELEKQLDEKRQAEAKAKAEQEKAAGQEIPVQRGFSDANPVTMDEKQVDGVAVEQGLPADATLDQAEAGGQGQDAAPPVVTEKPTGKGGKAGKSGGKPKGGKGKR